MYKIDKTLYDNKVTRKYAVKLGKLKKGEKLSIVSDAMFKSMFQTHGKEKYACYLISQFTDYFNVKLQHRSIFFIIFRNHNMTSMGYIVL